MESSFPINLLFRPRQSGDNEQSSLAPSFKSNKFLPHCFLSPAPLSLFFRKKDFFSSSSSSPPRNVPVRASSVVERKTFRCFASPNFFGFLVSRSTSLYALCIIFSSSLGLTAAAAAAAALLLLNYQHVLLRASASSGTLDSTRTGEDWSPGIIPRYSASVVLLLLQEQEHLDSSLHHGGHLSFNARFSFKLGVSTSSL